MAKKKNDNILVCLILLLLFLVIGMFVFIIRTVDVPADEPVQTEPSEVTTEPAVIFDKDDPNLILINGEHTVDEDYAPDELVYIDESMRAEDRAPQYQRMQPEAAEAFEAMMTAAAEDGMVMKVTTAYRPYSYQADLYYYYLAVKGEEWTEKYSSMPGTSEHQVGLAADVSCESIDYTLDISFAETDEYAWLEEHAGDYGFVIRYPEGKKDITGHDYEPWHIRYVGKDAAKVITEKGLTLEEFLGQI